MEITINEYAKCSCGAWARVLRGEKGYRDRMICSKCGSITVQDNIIGRQLPIKISNGEAESEDDLSG